MTICAAICYTHIQNIVSPVSFLLVIMNRKRKKKKVKELLFIGPPHNDTKSLCNHNKRACVVRAVCLFEYESNKIMCSSVNIISLYACELLRATMVSLIYFLAKQKHLFCKHLVLYEVCCVS